MDEERHSTARTWLRLSDAAEYLGVHPTTLRRWSDEGQVACIRTPGGRRRFAQTALDDFLAALSKPAHQTGSDSPALPDAFAHAPMSSKMGHPGIRDESWYGQIEDSRRHAFRRQGQQLMSALMHYVTRDDPGEIYLQEGTRLAREYAQLSVSAGLSIMDTTRAFMTVKRSITSTLHETGSLDGPPDAATWHLYKRTQDFLDHILMAILNVYQEIAA